MLGAPQGEPETKLYCKVLLLPVPSYSDMRPILPHHRGTRSVMNGNKLIALATLAFAEIFAEMTAQADSGVYFGGGVGRTKVEDSSGNPTGVLLDQTAAGLKVFAGYRLDAIPLIKFAAEVGYRELGRADYRIHGPDYGVLAGVALGPVVLFGRVGAMNYELEKVTGGGNNSFDGTAPVYGVGAWFTIRRVGIRAELERIDIQELDKAYMYSVSVLYQF